MNKVQHPSNNRVLGAPEGWDQGALPCSALAITDIDWEGVPAIVSFWAPTVEELALLNAGHPVALSVCGRTMPPVSLFVGSKG